MSLGFEAVGLLPAFFHMRTISTRLKLKPVCPELIHSNENKRIQFQAPATIQVAEESTLDQTGSVSYIQ
jgi:hypothetical protein